MDLYRTTVLLLTQSDLFHVCHRLSKSWLCVRERSLGQHLMMFKSGSLFKRWICIVQQFCCRRKVIYLFHVCHHQSKSWLCVRKQSLGQHVMMFRGQSLFKQWFSIVQQFCCRCKVICFLSLTICQSHGCVCGNNL